MATGFRPGFAITAGLMLIATAQQAYNQLTLSGGTPLPGIGEKASDTIATQVVVLKFSQVLVVHVDLTPAGIDYLGENAKSPASLVAALDNPARAVARAVAPQLPDLHRGPGRGRGSRDHAEPLHRPGQPRALLRTRQASRDAVGGPHSEAEAKRFFDKPVDWCSKLPSGGGS
jgi:hypothetical protein